MTDTANYRGYLEVYTGRRWYFMNPTPADVTITDIAHALSNLCRFGGHCARFYSVAEHSVLVSRDLEDRGHNIQEVFAGLLHDGSEAYLVDMPRPLKQQLKEYNRLETLAWYAVATHFNLPLVLAPSVLEADNAVLLSEKESIVTAGEPWEWAVGLRRSAIKPSCLLPVDAKILFLERFYELHAKYVEWLWLQQKPLVTALK